MVFKLGNSSMVMAPVGLRSWSSGGLVNTLVNGWFNDSVNGLVNAVVNGWLSGSVNGLVNVVVSGLVSGGGSHLLFWDAL